MKPRTLTAICALLYLVPRPLPAQQQGDFRLAAVELAKLPRLFEVVDRASPGKALEPSEFLLRLDGKTGTVATGTARFRETGQGIALIVALDASGSMKGKPMEAIRRGLAGLVGRKREPDRVAMLSFANDIRWEARWDSDPAAVESALRGLESRGNQTRLYDAVGAALDEFAARGDLPDRRAVLLISDGLDEGSASSQAELAKRLRASRVRFDSAGMANDSRWFSRLRDLTKAGFGEFQEAADTDSLTRMLDQGIDRLLDQPTLEFGAADLARDARLHPIGVEHNPTAWRAELQVMVPEQPVWRRTGVWIGGGAILTLLVGGLVFFLQKSQPTAAAPQPAPPRPIPPPLALRTIIHPKSSLEPAPTPCLRVLSGPHAGSRASLAAPEFWIGSSANNHLNLGGDVSVSGNHACIRTTGGFLQLHDPGSLNGTLVNGRSVGQEVVALQIGDTLRIGNSDLRLEA